MSNVERPHDLHDAEAAWGDARPRRALRLSDVVAVPARLSLVAGFARAAMRDPIAGRIALLAIRGHRALQKPIELVTYLRILRTHRLDRCLEVGTAWGGMFFAHAAAASPGAHVIAIDAFPRESVDAMTTRFRGLARPGQRVTCVWRDSHDESTAATVAAALDGPLDLLFLDGDHSFDGVARDFALYEPLVRRGGLIALHDIDAAASEGVPAFWREVRERYEHREIVDRRHPPGGLGIGILVKP